MAPRRRTYHHGDLEEALLGAAERLIAEKGVLGFSLREAAREVGVDPAACYRHFRDRDAVLHALARRGFTRLAQQMERAVARTRTPQTALRALGHAYVAFASERPSEFRVMFGPNGLGARDPRLRGDYERGGFDILLDTLRGWKTATPAPEVERLAMVLWAGVHGVASLVVDGAWRIGEEERDSIIDQLLDRMLA
jgi:AcrR family transcriptional regulator